MAVDMFLKLDGVKGEAADSKHKGEIEVLSWSFGMSNAGSAHHGGGGGTGKVNIHDLSFTKHVDAASPNLMLFCCNGKHIDNAVLTVRKAGENPLEYLKIKMEQVFVSSVSTAGHGSEQLTENVTLNFSKFHTEYTPQGAKGSGEAAQQMGWDISAHKKI